MGNVVFEDYKLVLANIDTTLEERKRKEKDLKDEGEQLKTEMSANLQKLGERDREMEERTSMEFSNVRIAVNGIEQSKQALATSLHKELAETSDFPFVL